MTAKRGKRPAGHVGGTHGPGGTELGARDGDPPGVGDSPRRSQVNHTLSTHWGLDPCYNHNVAAINNFTLT